MKKLVLLSFAVSLGLNAGAQSNVAYPPSKAFPNEQFSPARPVVKIDASQRVRKGGSPTTQAVGTVNLATGPNAFGSIAVRTQVWADPTLNAITFIHRNDNTVNGGTSGDLRFDYSKDGGATWTIDVGLCYTSSGSFNDPSVPFSIARYPQGGITNPSGNTFADSAFQSWFGPSRDGSNPDASGGDWGGHVYGSYQLAAVDTGRQEEVHSDPANGFYNLISRGHMITKTGGTCFNLDYSVDFTNSLDYTDNVILTKGVWNNAKRDYDYSRSLVSVPVETDVDGNKLFTDFKLSMADNGMDGYISVIGHDSWAFSQDSVYYLTVYKTTDGGATWVGPTDIILHDVDPLLLNAGAGTLYTTGFEHDAAVDGNGNLHMVVAIGPSAGGFSIGTASGEWGIFDVYTTDGGNNWCAKLLGNPATFRGTFGDPNDATNQELSEDSRPQVSRTWDGTKLFFSWFDTDTVTFGGLGNAYPNWICVGMDIATGNTTPVTNFTALTAADASAMFANVSYYVLDNAGVYTIPAVYCLLNGTAPSGAPLGTGVQVNYTYISGATFADADFTNPTTCTALDATSAGVQTQTAGPLTVSNNYPNPVTGTTSFDIFLLNKADVTVEITNVLGQVMSTTVYSNMNGGKHILTIDASEFAAGVYNYTVKIADFEVSKQMIVK